MTSDPPPEFHSNEWAQCQSWLLPDVSSAAIIVPSAEKEAKDQQANETEQEGERGIDTENESVEDVVTDTIEPLTAERLQEITEAAEKEGYEVGIQQGQKEGQQQGYQQGIEDAKKDVNDQLERLQRITEALALPLKSEQKTIENMLVNMVADLSKTIVKRELLLNSSQITSVVQQTLDLLPANNQEFTLYLNSQDQALIENFLEDIEATFKLKADDNLLPGGCRLESHHTSIDATIETQTEKLLDAFLHKQLSQAQDEEITPTSETPVTDKALADGQGTQEARPE